MYGFVPQAVKCLEPRWEAKMGDQDGEGSQGQDFQEAAEVTWSVQFRKEKAEGDLITI